MNYHRFSEHAVASTRLCYLANITKSSVISSKKQNSQYCSSYYEKLLHNKISKTILKTIIIASVLFGICLPVYAGDFKTSHDFLNWKRGQQDHFFQVSVMMAATIAAQVKTKLGNCIVDWYSNDPKTIVKRHDEILRVMKGLPDYRPSAIVLAVLHKKCGKFTD